MSNCKNSVFQVGPRPHKDKKKLPQIETRETQYSPVVGNPLQDQAANLFQDFVSLHEKYESESESRSTVRVVHVATQEVQASLDATAKVLCQKNIKSITNLLQCPPEPPRTWFPGASSPSKPKASKAALPPPRWGGSQIKEKEVFSIKADLWKTKKASSEVT